MLQFTPPEPNTPPVIINPGGSNVTTDAAGGISDLIASITSNPLYLVAGGLLIYLMVRK